MTAFARKKDADQAWKTAEVRLAEGRLGDPRRGRQIFQRYVEVEWLPNHVVEATTREGYTYSTYKHIMPWFGPMRMNQIMPADVRERVTHLTNGKIRPSNLRTLKSTLSAVFTTALNDQVTVLHPCKGVKTPTVPPVPLAIVTLEQFDAIYQALPDAGAQLLVEAAIETSLRWGELVELRPRDLNLISGILSVSRVQVKVKPKFHSGAGQFLVRDYPKERRHRRLKLSTQIVAKLTAHTQRHGLQSDDLYFTVARFGQATPGLKVIPSPEQLGLTEPNDAGRRYLHGTLTAYTAGKCRCGTAEERLPSTGRSAVPAEGTCPGDRGPSTLMGASPAGGSAITSGCLPSKQRTSGSASESTTCVMLTPRGSSRAAPTWPS